MMTFDLGEREGPIQPPQKGSIDETPPNPRTSPISMERGGSQGPGSINAECVCWGQGLGRGGGH